MAIKKTKADVEDWCLSTDGIFHVRDAMREMQLDKSQEQTLRTALTRLVSDGILVRVGGKIGNYRLVEDDDEDIDIFGESKFFNEFRWPFPLHKYVRVGRKGLVVIAAEQGLCKTGFCLNVAMMNAETYQNRIWYYDSETGPDLLQERLFAMDSDLKPPLPFHLKSMPANPEDAVKKHPDDIVILDYVEEPEEAWRVAGILKRLSDVTREGMVVVALQKPPGRDAAYGGPQVLGKPQLYLAASTVEGVKQLKIVKCKSRVNGNVNPENKIWTFQLENLGTHFTNIYPPAIDDEIF